MQNAFPTISDPGAPGTAAAEKVTTGSKMNRFLRDSGSGEDFAPFLSAWARALEAAESGESVEYLDLTLSADREEADEAGNGFERTTSFPLNGISDVLSLSQSLEESLRAGLEESLRREGIGSDMLPEVLDGFFEDSVHGGPGEKLSETDTRRLSALLDRLRNRATVKSDGDGRLKVGVVLSDTLTLRLEASLRSGDGAEETDARVVPEAQHVLPGNGAEEEASGPESRLRALQEGRKSGFFAPAAKSATKTRSEETNGSSDAGASLLSEDVLLQTVFPAQEPSARENENAKPATEAEGERSGRIRKNRSGENGEIGKNEENFSESESGKRRGVTVSAERASGFDSFFEGVMARRNRADAGGEVLELAKGSSLKEGEALREGLENVVRFIRVSGEQKALLIVDPPALGRISVELTGGTSGLEASIKVGSEQIRQLVQDQLVQLRTALEQQGVQLTHFSVDVRQDDGRKQEERRSGGKVARASGGEDAPDDAQDERTIFGVDLTRGLLSWIA